MEGRATTPSFTRRSSLAALFAGASTGAFAWNGAQAATQTYQPAADIVVAKDGSGQFTSVHAAVQSVSKDNRERKIILVKNGLYTERLRVDAPYVTLRGETRSGVRIEFDWPDEGSRGDPLGQAILNISASAHDFVAENLTVQNTVSATGPHAFAVMGRADRTVIQDCDLYSLGADTLALWRTGKSGAEAGRSEGPGATPLTQNGGRYYHARLRVAGAVDFVCPRGWCYMTDSVILQVNPIVDAAIWHYSTAPEHKFVLTKTLFDGPPGFYLGRKHVDAAFYLIDCTFSDRMRDAPIYRVIYPLGGRPVTEADIQKNRDLDKQNVLGDRAYYQNARRTAGLYSWMRNNLATAPGAPKASDITAKWTFGGTWDPERAAPSVTAVKLTTDAVELTFSELVTVKGAPYLALRGGGKSVYLGGSGTNTLRFTRGSGAPGALDFSAGVIIASEAAAAIQTASLKLPRA